jgi:hypothetical protein
MRTSPARTGLVFLGAASALLQLTSSASAETFRWTQPAGSAVVEEFLLWVGPTTDVGELVYAGLPVPDASGIYSTDVQVDEIDQGIPVYVWLTAANSHGESDPSNANFYPVGCDPVLDADCDGVLDVDDNCPFAWNEGQEDTGGIGATSFPDGIGDACQCGDANGDGRVSSVDVAVVMRSLMQPPSATMVRPELCDVGGSLDCSTVDAAIAFRALMTPPIATIQQQCEPAEPLLP